ncbi:MAG: DUF624 domain-containing protein [Oscillospiraceae bacterium]|nr:DUF624 domain-containing protein [Oscillospiraceae bacterium]
MGLFSKYEKVGPGVSKNPDAKAPIFKFFELYGSHFSKLIILNLILLLSLLPFCLIFLVEYLGLEGTAFNVVFYGAFALLAAFIGPALCGFMKILRNISCERPVFIWHDYWKAFKANFKQGIVMGFIDSVFIIAISFAFPVYFSLAEQSNVFYIPFAVCLIVSLIFLMMHFYIYLLIVSTNLSLWKIIKNSFLLTAIDVKISFINLAVTVLLVLAIAMFWPYTSFVFVVIPSFLGLMYAFNCFPIIRKYVIQPYYDERGEENPEFAYKDTEGEAVFVDTPETEIPQEQPKQSKKRSIK